MRRFFQIAVLIVFALQLRAQQVIDRVMVVVNDHVITQNDWDEQERFEALLEGRPPSAMERSEASLEHLIDRELLLQQMNELNFRAPSPELVQEQVASIRKQLPAAQAGTDQAWHKTLQQAGLPEEDFGRIVTEHANVLRFIDVRFRANARLAPFDIENYYREQFVPEFEKSSGGKPAPPLKQVQDKIQQILVEQRVTEQLDSFVQSLRAQATIRRLAPMEVRP